MNIGSPTAAAEENFSFHTSFQDIGKKLKACNDTLGELQSLGISHDVPLPELVLVGDQSAGKSSVMSGLANLDLPRSEGTCTRCPLHIRVSRNSDWSCRVSLSKEYRYDPPRDRSISETDVTEQDPFFPWRKLSANQIFEFKTVHDKGEIEDVLRWAQVAILNDDQRHELYIPGLGAIAQQTDINQAAKETQAKFSPNVVFLEIKGPELPNLSFYDMPGIFQNPADARDDYLVNVVCNLSMGYIRRQSAIIICSMPMNSDAENSFTFGLVRKLKASDRTIGVLTKADLLPEGGNHSPWLDIMQGGSHRAGLGYYITSRPQGKDLDELKTWEEAIFEAHTVDNWPESFHPFVDRCGVERLKNYLSQKLGEQFVKRFASTVPSYMIQMLTDTLSLPQIEHKVKINLDKVQRQLATLPELPDNVELEIKTSLLRFTESARGALDKFSKYLGPLAPNFKDCIIEIKPKFVLRDQSDIPVHEISDNESDDAESVTTAGPVNTPSKRRTTAPQVTPNKRYRSSTPVLVKSEGSQRPGANGPSTPRAPEPKLKAPFTEFERIGSGFRTLRQVREEIQQKTRSGMPNYIPEDVYESLVLESMQPWDKPMMAFLDEAMHLVQEQLDKALDRAFGGLKKRLVFQEAKKHLRVFLNKHQIMTKEAIFEIYATETEQLLTFNNEAFGQYLREDTHLLTRFRHKMRMEAKGLLPPRPLEDWSKMTEAKRKEDTKRREDELQKIGTDQFEREVEVIGYIRSYYRLAALRFVDNVSQCVMCRMIPRIKRELSPYLHRELGLMENTGPEVYARLIEENPAMAQRRDTLKKEKAKFEKALASIDALNSGVSEEGQDVTEDGVEHDMEEDMIEDTTMIYEDGGI